MITIEQYNTDLAPRYIAALHRCYATLHGDAAAHETATEQRMAVQDQMWTAFHEIDVPFYIDPETLLLVEGMIPHREGWISCLILDGEGQGSMYLDADDYDMPLGLEARIIGEECRRTAIGGEAQSDCWCDEDELAHIEDDLRSNQMSSINEN
jgi:hypothetical protein